ncbi:MAG: hypothetical protein EHM47_03770 [Ignavibacteriales bacterium]|nr:MAG: hypothetical protein EHM47_03770 [Ignavibacteriales bacterium]
MKSLISIVVIAAGILFLSGCTEETNITAPETNYTSGPNWITLPEREGSMVENIIAKTRNINGSSGGEIIIDFNYNGGPHGEVKVIAKLLFRAGSFSGTKAITMTIDDVNGTITYSPSMNFNKDAELYVKLEGLNLYGINPNNVDFSYHDPSGTFGPVDYKEIIVDIPSGILELKEGKIPHFSRYGFSR